MHTWPLTTVTQPSSVYYARSPKAVGSTLSRKPSDSALLIKRTMSRCEGNAPLLIGSLTVRLPRRSLRYSDWQAIDTNALIKETVSLCQVDEAHLRRVFETMSRYFEERRPFDDWVQLVYMIADASGLYVRHARARCHFATTTRSSAFVNRIPG